MAGITFSPEAVRDLLEIVDYLADVAGQSVARRYEEEFRRAIDSLRDLPASGSPRPEFGMGVRIVIVRPYLVFYQFKAVEDAVYVLRLLHGHRTVTSQLLRGKPQLDEIEGWRVTVRPTIFRIAKHERVRAARP
jgi:plasmid stabilization system protein ParE